jgi:hypothetical protein
VVAPAPVPLLPPRSGGLVAGRRHAPARVRRSPSLFPRNWVRHCMLCLLSLVLALLFGKTYRNIYESSSSVWLQVCGGGWEQWRPPFLPLRPVREGPCERPAGFVDARRTRLLRSLGPRLWDRYLPIANLLF